MSGQVYVEENKHYSFDFTNAIWSSDRLNQLYKLVHSLLSDVDFMAETENGIIFLEYKNANILGASNPQAFAPSDDRYIIKIARKYFDSILYALACKKEKQFRYVYILEYPNGDVISRKFIRNKIKPKLPFELQKDQDIFENLIASFEVLSINEWNIHPIYSQFPVTPSHSPQAGVI